MSIPARYSGVCPECCERWQPGDLIRSDQLNDVGMALWTHAVCPDATVDALMAPARTGEVSCPVCSLPLLLPTVPGKVHGIVSVDPITVQCDECAKRVDYRTLGLSSDHHNLTILTCGIEFNSALYPHDPRRLCRDCAHEAGWDR